MPYQRLVNHMKSLNMRKSIAALGAATLAVTLSVAITPSASAAAPVCASAAGVETCTGTLANGAGYVFKVPANFGGTMFFW
jgi:tetrahydromethanopterin S-methyltransferase subunit D